MEADGAGREQEIRVSPRRLAGRGAAHEGGGFRVYCRHGAHEAGRAVLRRVGREG